MLREVVDVRFGSKADMCAAKGHVRFTPDSDRESRHPHKVMSALLPKADMCSARDHVCYGPKADIMRRSKITLLDHLVGAGEQRLIARSNLVEPQLGPRTELLPVTCFEFFISEPTSNACPNPRT